MNVSRYVAVTVDRISLGNEIMKALIDCDEVETF